MMLENDEKYLLARLREDPEGILRARARPSELIRRLEKKGAIANVLTTTLSPRGSRGGISHWKLTEKGRAMIDWASNDAD